MLIAALTDSAGFWAFLVAIPTVTIAYLGYRRGQRADKSTQAFEDRTLHSGNVSEAFEGLNTLVKALQADNRELRRHLSNVEIKLQKIIQQNDELRSEIRRLNKVIAGPGPGVGPTITLTKGEQPNGTANPGEGPSSA